MKTFKEIQNGNSPYCGMKESTLQTINDYVEKGWEPGGFTTAVLANDLMMAFCRADEENRHSLFQICNYVYNEIPSSCHGSYEVVESWLNSFRSKVPNEMS